VFGSATRDDFDPERSDVDLLVEFGPGQGTDKLRSYIGLREALTALFGRLVDLVRASADRNRYIQADIDATLQEVYAA